ncbi:Endogenous retrovirus group V member 2 Env polyprotein [Merluccius polli]|uniref:Endogenous retrovirus group V member 2 Env polyprotein n=1 Tax=Merluccius polli TaxID=89951 RepID=A0AA47M6R0_MERPO|nr:Endogenous retrovirus group V member 2 Env polyprotein [Merluccius polli]
MEAIARQHVHNCQTCQAHNPRPSQKPPQGHFPVPPLPFQELLPPRHLRFPTRLLLPYLVTTSTSRSTRGSHWVQGGKAHTRPSSRGNPPTNGRSSRSHKVSQRLLRGALLSVLAGTLFLYGLLRLIVANPVPIPTTTWRWGFLENDGTNSTNATCANDTQGTVHNPPLAYNPPARRRRTILPHDDPHAPRRNDSDPCLRQFDGVQLTHINGTKRIPRGVPNEYKLADQIGAGFENIPILSGLFPITPNKNVDRINYIHYNVQRLANLTRDAVEGISTQLAATSLMAFQNRVALDMLLAEKGGVCAMFGDQCCTFIPNNTAPDGSVTKALNGLRALSTELKEASGLDNPLEAWMQGLFGRWKALVMAVLTSLACFLAILITCGCCCIPCARTLCVRLIATTLSKENAPKDYEHQMVSLLVEPCHDDDDYYRDVTPTIY